MSAKNSKQTNIYLNKQIKSLLAQSAGKSGDFFSDIDLQLSNRDWIIAINLTLCVVP